MPRRRKQVITDNNTVAKVNKKLPDNPIELTECPVWSQQLSEPDYWFDKFNNYYLTLPPSEQSTVTAYRNYVKDRRTSNLSKPKAPHVADIWYDACRVFRWEERSERYWESHILKQLAHHEEELNKRLRLKEQISVKALEDALETLKTSQSLRDKRDAMVLAEKSCVIMDSIERLIQTDMAIQFLTQQGYVVTDPTQPPSIPESDSP